MTKSPRPRCSAILPANWLTGRKEGQCRKRANVTVETRTGYSIVHDCCGSDECYMWIQAGKSVKWL